MEHLYGFLKDYNYGSYLFNKVVSSRLIKNKLADILIAITANVLEMQVVTGLCWLSLTDTWLDYIIPIGISSLLAININYFYLALEPYRNNYYQLSKYLIENYTFENYIYWKRLIVTGLTIYGLGMMMLVEINNQFIIIYLSQTFVSFLIVDHYEQRFFHKVIEDYKDKPISKIHHPIPLLENDNNLKESYFPNRDKHYEKEQYKKMDREPIVLWLNDGDSDEEEMRENYGLILRNSLRREGLNESFIMRGNRSCSF